MPSWTLFDDNPVSILLVLLLFSGQPIKVESSLMTSTYDHSQRLSNQISQDNLDGICKLRGTWNRDLSACACVFPYDGRFCEKLNCKYGDYIIYSGKCDCYEGYQGYLCEHRCIHGQVRSNVCVCSEGYVGYGCEYDDSSSSNGQYNSVVFAAMVIIFVAIGAFSCLTTLRRTRLRVIQRDLAAQERNSNIMATDSSSFRQSMFSTGSSRESAIIDSQTMQFLGQMPPPPPKYEEVVVSGFTNAAEHSSSSSSLVSVPAAIPPLVVTNRPGSTIIEPPPSYAQVQVNSTITSPETNTDLSNSFEAAHVSAVTTTSENSRCQTLGHQTNA